MARPDNSTAAILMSEPIAIFMHTTCTQWFSWFPVLYILTLCFFGLKVHFILDLPLGATAKLPRQLPTLLSSSTLPSIIATSPLYTDTTSARQKLRVVRALTCRLQVIPMDFDIIRGLPQAQEEVKPCTALLHRNPTSPTVTVFSVSCKSR